MRLDVFFTPAELVGAELAEHVVVVDVLRATSTIVEALSNGARAVFPVATADDAARIGQNIGRDSALLVGERKALPIEGFDLGNAPGEFTAERVAGRSLVMTTTNGTAAFLAVAERRGGAGGVGAAGGARGGAEAGGVLVGSYLNLSAVARLLVQAGGRAAIVCAGREGRFGLDDAACAGALIRRLEEEGVRPELNDGGHAARGLAEPGRSVRSALEASAAGRRLIEVGRAEDLDFCAQVDRAGIVPVLRERKITVE